MPSIDENRAKFALVGWSLDIFSISDMEELGMSDKGIHDLECHCSDDVQMVQKFLSTETGDVHYMCPRCKFMFCNVED